MRISDWSSDVCSSDLVSGAQLTDELGVICGQYGLGRGIHVGETALGNKGRIGFEAGAALLLIAAHRELEKLVLTKWQTFWKDQLGRLDRKSVVQGKSVSGSVALGGGRTIKKKK